MKAKQRTLLVLFVLLAAGAVVFALLTLNGKKAEAESEAAAEGSIVLSSFSADALTALAYEQGGGTITLEKAGEVWQLADDPAYHLNQTAVNSMATALCALTAKREIDSPGPLADFGLDAPSLTVTATVDGETTTFLFGDTNAATGDVYLCTGDGAGVYTVAAAKKECFAYDKAGLFGSFGPTGLTADAITAVEYTFADSTENFHVALEAVSEPVTEEGGAGASADSADPADAESAEDGSVDGTGSGDSDEATTQYQKTWRLTDDPEAAVDQDAVDEMLSRITASVSGQVTAPQSLADYGLVAPLLRITLRTGTGNVALCLGVGSDGCYMMQDGDSSVYTVELEVLNAFCLTREELTAAEAKSTGA